jgi:hypothetical protein
MLLSDDSILHRIPNGLAAATVQQLDGIRYAIMMADVSYARLSDTPASVDIGGRERSTTPRLCAAAFHDCWSVIDCVNRLRKLLPEAYLLERTPAITPFLAETETVRVIRNSFQHAGERIKEAVPFPMPGTPPLWGTLEWVTPASDGPSARQFSLTPGTRTFRWASSAVIGRPFPRAPVDHIALTAFGDTAFVTQIHDALGRLVRGLEDVTPKVDTGPSFSDLLMTFTVSYDRPPTAGES